MRHVFLLALGLSGCRSPETAALITVDPASTQPASLRLTFFGDGQIAPPTHVSLAGHLLPGALLAGDLDPATRRLRVLVDGLDPAGRIASQGAAPVQLVALHTVGTTVHLSDGALTDGDGDGVPDVIDDCPQTPDPDQRCAPV